jgi:hypothetical protein
MTPPRPPSYLRRAKWLSRAQLALAILAAGFVIYRLLSAFSGRPGVLR